VSFLRESGLVADGQRGSSMRSGRRVRTSLSGESGVINAETERGMKARCEEIEDIA